MRTLVGRARGAVAGKRDLHLRSGSDRGLRLATLPLLLRLRLSLYSGRALAAGDTQDLGLRDMAHD